MKAEIVPSPDRFEGEPELNKCISLSATAWLGKIDGETACIWGLIPPSILSEQAYLWLFTTELVESHKFMFVRWSQRFLEVMHKDYPVIVGHCEIGNAAGDELDQVARREVWRAPREENPLRDKEADEWLVRESSAALG